MDRGRAEVLEIAGKRINNLTVVGNELFVSASYGISKINLIKNHKECAIASIFIT